MQEIDPFENNGWLSDGSIDWIDSAFPKEIESLFAEKNAQSENEFENVNEEEDDENIDEADENEDENEEEQ